MAKDLQSAVERARMVAAKITGQLHDGPSKRSADSNDETSAKKFASVNDAVGAQLAMLKAQQSGGNATSEEIKVPDKLVGLVIGKGGDQLHRLQSDTECKVIISPDSHGLPDRSFTLVGSKDAIERCKKAIEEILKRGANPSLNDPSSLYARGNLEIVEIKVPGNKCGLVIGKGGETIKGLGEKYGVKLVVVQDTSAATSGDKPLRITGEPEKVAKAKEAVMALINPPNRFGTNEYGSKTGSSTNETYIKVPGDKAGIVIGKGGESIKEINRRSGAHVEIDKSQRNVSDSTDKMFVIRGTNEQIQYAQQLIYEKITGIQGSQPPTGFFNNNELSQVNNGYDHGYGSPSQQWAASFQPWSSQAITDSKSATDPNAAAWAAYYQQYYGQVGGPAQTESTTPGAASTVQPSINPQTGQADYSQAWVQYYRSLGMHEQADAILRQTQNQTNGSSNATSGATPTQQSQPSSSNTQTNGNGYGSYTNY